MVSWDMKVKFFGISPHIKELVELAKQEGFSNIEEIKFLKSDKEGDAIYWLSVNDRGAKQKEFKCEKVN